MDNQRENLIINQLAQNFAQKVAILEGEKAMLQVDLMVIKAKVEELENEIEGDK